MLTHTHTLTTQHKTAQRRKRWLSAIQHHKWVKKVKRPKASVRFEHLCAFAFLTFSLSLSRSFCASVISSSSPLRSVLLVLFFFFLFVFCVQKTTCTRWFCYFLLICFAFDSQWYGDADVYFQSQVVQTVTLVILNVIKVNDELRENWMPPHMWVWVWVCWLHAVQVEVEVEAEVATCNLQSIDVQL